MDSFLSVYMFLTAWQDLLDHLFEKTRFFLDYHNVSFFCHADFSVALLTIAPF